jgi:hypothetical protein
VFGFAVVVRAGVRGARALGALVAGRAAFFTAGAFFAVLAAGDGAAGVAVVRAVVLKMHPSLSDRIKSDRSPPTESGGPAGLRGFGAVAPFTHSHNGLRG